MISNDDDDDEPLPSGNVNISLVGVLCIPAILEIFFFFPEDFELGKNISSTLSSFLKYLCCGRWRYEEKKVDFY